MQRLVIHVKDEAKLSALMSVLQEINFIEVEREKKALPDQRATVN